MRRELLSDDAIADAIGELPGWEHSGGRLVTDVDCGSFAHAIAFVVEVGFVAEALDHHPDVDVRWKRVRLAVSTHDRGGITDFDVELARRVSEFAPTGGE